MNRLRTGLFALRFTVLLLTELGVRGKQDRVNLGMMAKNGGQVNMQEGQAR